VELFLQQVANGIMVGGIYGLMALGLTLIYGVLRILNIAHGSLYALGAYAGASLVIVYLGQGFWPGGSYLVLLGAALAMGLIAGPLIERGLLR